MSNAPYLLPGARGGLRMGDAKLIDSMIYDGLWDPYSDFHMGNCAELCARKYDFSREGQDAYALESYRGRGPHRLRGARRGDCTRSAFRSDAGTPVVDRTRRGAICAPLEKMPSLRPAFDEEGTVTAANASTINDGAAAVVICSSRPGARAWSPSSCSPSSPNRRSRRRPNGLRRLRSSRFRNSCYRTGRTVEDIDLFEINEAFAVVAMAAIRELASRSGQGSTRGGASPSATRSAPRALASRRR